MSQNGALLSFMSFVLATVLLASICWMGSPLAHRHAALQRMSMANEIRHKGPVMGQMVYYVTSGTRMPALVRSTNADGTVNLTTFPGGSVVADVSSIQYDPTLTKNPSWYWSDDL